jgi:hypothetical protein
MGWGGGSGKLDPIKNASEFYSAISIPEKAVIGII